MEGKSFSKSKKWVIALAILVAIAVVTVVVIFTIPKNVNKVRERIAEFNSTMFLEDENEEKLYDNFVEKIKVDSASNLLESQNSQTVAHVLHDLLAFYDQTLMFANDNSTFQKEYKIIMDSLKSAQSQQEGMNSLLIEVEQKVENSADYTEWAWGQFKEQYKNYLTSMTSALKSLAKVYKDCIPQGNLNNPLVVTTLETANDFLDVLAEQECKTKLTVEYTSTFISSYIFRGDAAFLTSPVFKYEFSPAIKESYNKINEFSTIYTDKTIKSVIQSIEPTGLTFSASEDDTEGTLEAVKTFLSGGLK